MLIYLFKIQERLHIFENLLVFVKLMHHISKENETAAFVHTELLLTKP